MSDELDRIRQARRDEQCEADATPLIPLRDPSGRVEPPCDPVEPKKSDTYYPPKTAPAPEPAPHRLPDAITVYCPAVTSPCPVGTQPYGTGAGVVSAGEFTDEVFLESIITLTRSELYRIQPNIADLQTFTDTNLPLLDSATITAEDFDDGIIAITLMEDTPAAELRVALLDAYQSLKDTATELAAQRSQCLWQSQELWLVCDYLQGIGYEAVYVDPGAGPTQVHSLAGASTSTISQADADSKAVIAASSSLSCLYGNTLQTATCLDVDIGFGTALAEAVDWLGTDYTSLSTLSAAGFEARELSDPSTARPLIYTATSPADTFFAGTPALANQIAMNDAISRLDCFWPSPKKTYTCLDQNSGVNDFVNRVNVMIADNTWAAAYTNTATAMAALWTEMISGAHDTVPAPTVPTNVVITAAPDYDVDVTQALVVNMPSGTFTSETSQSEAAEAADSYALTLLQCQWSSPAVNCACQDISGDPAYNTKIYLDMDQSEETATLDAGAFTDSTFPGVDINGETAWDALGDYCSSKLICVYCNLTIDPECEGAINATQGLTLDAVCRNTPDEALTFAVSIASIPPGTTEGGENCLYPNNYRRGRCDETYTWADGNDDPLTTTPNPDADHLSPATETNEVVAPAGMFTATSQALANAVAESFVLTSLVCIYQAAAYKQCDFLHDMRERMMDGTVNYPITGEPSRTVTHPPASLLFVGSPIVDVPPGGWPAQAPGSKDGDFDYIGQRALFVWPTPAPPSTYTNFAGVYPPGYELLTPPSTNGLGSPLSPGILSITVPFAIGYGESAESYFLAYSVAQADAESKLKCIYTNWHRVGMRCPGSWRYPIGDSGVALAGSVIAGSTMDANTQAEMQAMAASDCHQVDSAFGIGLGISGSSGAVSVSGASAKIDGQCFPCEVADEKQLSTYYYGVTGTSTTLPTSLSVGNYLFWAKIDCESDNLQINIWHESTTDTETQFQGANYYPQARYDALKLLYPDAKIFFLAAGVVDQKAGPNELLGLSRVYQHHAGPLQVSCGGDAAPPCPFGEVFNDGGTWKLRGGTVVAGPDVEDLADQSFSVLTPGLKYAWIEVDFTAYNSNSVALNGIESTSSIVMHINSAYPDQVIPKKSNSFIGKAIVPLGSIVISDSESAVMYPSFCGSVTVSHCPGSVGYSSS